MGDHVEKLISFEKKRVFLLLGQKLFKSPSYVVVFVVYATQVGRTKSALITNETRRLTIRHARTKVRFDIRRRRSLARVYVSVGAMFVEISARTVTRPNDNDNDIDLSFEISVRFCPRTPRGMSEQLFGTRSI